MSGQKRYRLNTPHVVAEAIEGQGASDAEAIVVNLDSGTYYSLTGDSMLIWNAIIDGVSADELTAAVSERTGEPANQVASVLDDFRRSLFEESLIVERSDATTVPAGCDLSTAGPGLLTPSLSSYSDMQDLILLDPVHEVDERGWPHVQQVG